MRAAHRFGEGAIVPLVGSTSKPPSRYRQCLCFEEIFEPGRLLVESVNHLRGQLQLAIDLLAVGLFQLREFSIRVALQVSLILCVVSSTRPIWFTRLFSTSHEQAAPRSQFLSCCGSKPLYYAGSIVIGVGVED